jgi:hypothetical protein
MNRPSAEQMSYLKTLMLSRPYFSRVPDQNVLIGQTGEGEEHIGATPDRDGSYAMIYSPKGKAFTVNMSKLRGLHAIALVVQSVHWRGDTDRGQIPDDGRHDFHSPVERCRKRLGTGSRCEQGFRRAWYP